MFIPLSVIVLSVLVMVIFAALWILDEVTLGKDEAELISLRKANAQLRDVAEAAVELLAAEPRLFHGLYQVALLRSLRAIPAYAKLLVIREDAVTYQRRRVADLTALPFDEAILQRRNGGQA